MSITRAYYDASLQKFLITEKDAILGKLTGSHQHSIEVLQRDAWDEQIPILQKQLKALKNYNAVHIALEYGIPRMGRRVDTVIFIDGVIFSIEFKLGSKTYSRDAIDQAWGYALDLKHFHEKSHALPIIPILVATRAAAQRNDIESYEDGVYYPLRCNQKNFVEHINMVMQSAKRNCFLSPQEWIKSAYKPTPNIIEAAQALYAKHEVEEISRSDAAATELKLTAQTIANVVEEAKRKKHKSICFVTGVPGAGKTLAGLNIASRRRYRDMNSEHAVFLSGNLPLVKVLQEALAKDSCRRIKERNAQKSPKERQGKVTIKMARREAEAFIQSVHHFREDHLDNARVPSEMVAIFDEAQRAWTLEQTKKYMEKRHKHINFNQSEPEFLISILNRHKDWAVIVCLVGSGQEIHTGEAGINEWFSALSDEKFSNWKIHVSKQLDKDAYKHCRRSQIAISKGLHLPVSMRAYRSESVSKFVHMLLESNADEAYKVFKTIENYPIVLTRDIDKAKEWINKKVRSAQRSGIVASSSGGRLKPYGINVKMKIDPQTWFLNPRTDVRSSNFLENVATEFEIQGLELDWVCVAWDADLRHSSKGWTYRKFIGTNWNEVKKVDKQAFLLNSYRVLLTRARQGMVIFVPRGDAEDATRKPNFYDATYRYLRACGIKDIEEG